MLTWPDYFQRCMEEKGTWILFFFPRFSVLFHSRKCGNKQQAIFNKNVQMQFCRCVEKQTSLAIGQCWEEPVGGDYWTSIVIVGVMENLPSARVTTSQGFWSAPVSKFSTKPLYQHTRNQFTLAAGPQAQPYPTAPIPTKAEGYLSLGSWWLGLCRHRTLRPKSLRAVRWIFWRWASKELCSSL